MGKLSQVSSYSLNDVQNPEFRTGSIKATLGILTPANLQFCQSLHAGCFNSYVNATGRQSYCSHLICQLFSGSRTPAQQQSQAAKLHLAARNSS